MAPAVVGAGEELGRHTIQILRMGTTADMAAVTEALQLRMATALILPREEGDPLVNTGGLSVAAGAERVDLILIVPKEESMSVEVVLGLGMR